MAGLSDVVSTIEDISVEGFKNAGNDCMKNQKYTAAIENYKRGLKLDPQNAVLNCNLAQAYLNKKEYEEAEKYAKLAIDQQASYVKAYYRASKAALGRHNVYDSMMYLADGVQKCGSQGLEDLFNMARELSPEFETSLRRCHQNQTEEERAASKTSTSQPGKKAPKAPSNTMFSGKSNADGCSVKAGKAGGVQSREDETEDWERKLDEKSEKKRKLEEEQELLKRKNKEVQDELERETRELEELQKKKEIREREKRDREKKEQEKRDRERKEQEKRDQERREQERRELEKRDRERREQEARDRLRREQEKRDRDLKEAERKARELEEYNRRMRVLEKRKVEEEKVQKELDAIEARKREVQNYMKEGSLALLRGLCRKAVDSLEKVLETIKSHPPPETLGISDPLDIVVLQFTYSQALVSSGEYKDIVKGIKVLESMEQEGKHNKFPAIFLMLGKAFVRLNRFKEAEEPLIRGLSFLHRGSSFSCFPWPGTDEVIDVTERKFLQKALQDELLDCKIYHKPDAICFYESCLTTNQHVIPSRNIFFSDPDFNGFVTIVCQENCHIYFHLSCWKYFKDHLSIEKLSDKDFLGRNCLTPDCKTKYSPHESAVIVKLVIIGPDGEEKSKCECAPPLPSVSSKEMTSALSKSPSKKQRKRELEKNNKRDHNKKKRTRCDSKGQGDVQTDHSATKKTSQGQQYADALSKLVTARENNFGYDNTAPNAYKVIDNTSPSLELKEKEGFIYSYFMEIFKKNGHMSIFELQEHWEANREILPVLDPALVTHTDLVKFLLDTEGFAVVQDTIGIAADLPKLSAVVESKSEPLPVLSGWQFSAATLQEASQTFSFNSPMELHSEEVDSSLDLKSEDSNQDFLNVCDKSSSSSSYHSTCENDTKEEGTTSSDLNGPSFDHASKQLEAKCANNNHSSGIVNGGAISSSSYTSSSRDMKTDVPPSVTPSDALSSNSNLNPSLPPLSVETSMAPSSNSPKVPVLGKSVKEPSSNNLISNHVKPVRGKNRLSNLPHVSTPQVNNNSIELTGKMKDLDINNETNNNYKVSTIATNSDKTVQDMQPVEQSSRRAAWKPGAKLFEWACGQFPNESKVKLCDALSKVRAENNNTLSGLSFDAILEKLRSTLCA